MGKPLFKTLSVLFVAIGAVAICFIGYRQNNHKQYEQRVEYAKTAISSEDTSLAAIETEIGSLYAGEDRAILRPGLQAEDVSKLVAKLASVKVSADDYGIEEDALPSEAKAIQEKKTALDDELKDAEAKIKVQAATDDLFTQAVSNWQAADNNVIIRTDLQATDVGNVRENLNFFADSAWKELVTAYLGFADAQLERITQLEQSFQSMLQDGTVTNEVTLEKYLAVVDSINQVRNEELKAKYQQLADSISTQMGYSYYGNTATTTTNTSTYSDTYSDTTAQDQSSWTDSGTSTESETTTDAETGTDTAY